MDSEDDGAVSGQDDWQEEPHEEGPAPEEDDDMAMEDNAIDTQARCWHSRGAR